MACQWILAKNTPPPMQFSALVEECLPKDVLPSVTRLLQQKATTSELGVGLRIDCLNDFLDTSMNEITNALTSFPKDDYPPWDDLNCVFKEIIQGV